MAIISEESASETATHEFRFVRSDVNQLRLASEEISRKLGEMARNTSIPSERAVGPARSTAVVTKNKPD